MSTLSITSTGVIVRIRSTAIEYGMHADCADALIDAIISASGGNVLLDDDFPAVVIGPLFADASEWTCAHSDCPHT